MTDVSKHKAGKNQRCSGCFTVLKVAQTRVTRDYEIYYIYKKGWNNLLRRLNLVEICCTIHNRNMASEVGLITRVN